MASDNRTSKLWLCAAAVAALGLGATSHAQEAPGPVVVELFQSQGCSSCPPANANVNALAGRPDVLALSYGVTYWDNLGWKDTFAKPQYTARQWDYAHALRHSNVGTPQVVVDGRRDLVGADRGDLEAAVRDARRGPGPQIKLQDGVVAVGAARAPARPASVWLVRYDPKVRQVPVRRGENGGKTLPHRNIVVEFTALGRWNGAAATYKLPPPTEPALATAILVQDGVAGPILAAAKS
jgi:hypothetical protein